jgi:hypothetical protein
MFVVAVRNGVNFVTGMTGLRREEYKDTIATNQLTSNSVSDLVPFLNNVRIRRFAHCVLFSSDSTRCFYL